MVVLVCDKAEVTMHVKQMKISVKKMVFCFAATALGVLWTGVAVNGAIWGATSIPDNFYNLGVALRSASPISTHLLETSMAQFFFEPYDVPRAEDWHRGIPVIVLKYWSLLTHARGGVWMKIPHLLWLGAWIGLAVALLKTAGRGTEPLRDSAGTFVVRLLPWFLPGLLLLGPVGRPLVVNTYLDDVPGGVAVLLGVWVLARNPSDLGHIAAGAGLFAVAFCCKALCLIWAPIGLCALWVEAACSERRTFVRRGTAIAAVYVCVYGLVCVPKALWNLHDLGVPVETVGVNWIRAFYFGPPKSDWHYPFFLYDDESYKSVLALSGGVVAALGRIWERPVWDAVAALTVTGFAWCWTSLAVVAFWRGSTGGRTDRFLRRLLGITLAGYFVFFAIGLGDGPEPRFWIAPVTLAAVCGLHGFGVLWVRWLSLWRRLCALAALAVCICVLQAFPEWESPTPLESVLSRRDAAFVTARIEQGGSVLMHPVAAVQYWSEHPLQSVVTLQPKYLQTLDDSQLERFLLLYDVECIWYPMSLSTQLRLRYWGFIERAVPGPSLLMTRDNPYRKLRSSSRASEPVAFAAELLKSGRTSEAIVILRRMMRKEPKSVAARNGLARILAAQGNLEEAESLYRSSIQANPGHPFAYFNLGALLEATERYEEALDYYARAFEIDPYDVQAAAALGRLSKGQGDCDEAMRYLNQALEIDPNCEDAIQALSEDCKPSVETIPNGS